MTCFLSPQHWRKYHDRHSLCCSGNHRCLPCWKVLKCNQSTFCEMTVIKKLTLGIRLEKSEKVFLYGYVLLFGLWLWYVLTRPNTFEP